MADELMTKSKGYEEKDIQVKTIVISGIVIFALVAIVIYLMIPLYNVFKKMTMPENPASAYYVESEVKSPVPMLEVHPYLLRQEFFAQQDVLIHSYGWIDAAKGIVRIPVDEAIKRTLQTGLPTREQQP